MFAILGYVTVSRRVAIEGARVGYLFRQQPLDDKDSGWRIFSGDESQEYVDDPTNLAQYNVSTIIRLDPSIKDILARDPPVAFERNRFGRFVEVDFRGRPGP